MSSDDSHTIRLIPPFLLSFFFLMASRRSVTSGNSIKQVCVGAIKATSHDSLRKNLINSVSSIPPRGMNKGAGVFVILKMEQVCALVLVGSQLISTDFNKVKCT